MIKEQKRFSQTLHQYIIPLLRKNLQITHVATAHLILDWIPSSRHSALTFQLLLARIPFYKDCILKLNRLSIVERFLPPCLLSEKLVVYREGRHSCEMVEASHFPPISLRVIFTCRPHSFVGIRTLGQKTYGTSEVMRLISVKDLARHPKYCSGWFLLSSTFTALFII